MSLSAKLLAEWLTSQLNKPFQVGPDDTEMPDEYGVVTVLPGTGMKREGTFYGAAFQITTRGVQRVAATAEDLAKQVDVLLMSPSTYPNELWGDYVTSCEWIGGAPSPVLTFDAGRRVTWTCSYLFDAAY